MGRCQLHTETGRRSAFASEAARSIREFGGDQFVAGDDRLQTGQTVFDAAKKAAKSKIAALVVSVLIGRIAKYIILRSADLGRVAGRGTSDGRTRIGSARIGQWVDHLPIGDQRLSKRRPPAARTAIRARDRRFQFVQPEGAKFAAPRID